MARQRLLLVGAVCLLGLALVSASESEPKGGMGFHPVIAPDNQNAMAEMEQVREREEQMMLNGMPGMYGMEGMMQPPYQYGVEGAPRISMRGRRKGVQDTSMDEQGGTVFGLDEAALQNVAGVPLPMMQEGGQYGFPSKKQAVGNTDSNLSEHEAMPQMPSMDYNGLMALPNTPPLPADMNAQALASAQQELNGMVGSDGGEEIPDMTGPFQVQMAESDPMVGGGEAGDMSAQGQATPQLGAQAPAEAQQTMPQEAAPQQQEAPQPVAPQPAADTPPAMSEAAPRKKAAKLDNDKSKDAPKAPLPDPGSILPAKAPESGAAGAAAAAGGAPSTQDGKDASAAPAAAATARTAKKTPAPAAHSAPAATKPEMNEPSATPAAAAAPAAVPMSPNLPQMEMNESVQKNKRARMKEMLGAINDIAKTLDALTSQLHIKKDVNKIRKNMEESK